MRTHKAANLPLSCSVSLIVVLSSGCIADEPNSQRLHLGPPVVTSAWTHVFDGGGDEIGHGVTSDGNGDVVVVGTAFNGANTDGIIRKYNAAGLIWSVAFDQGNDDEAFAVATDSVDNVFVVGTSDNGVDIDLWLRKYDRTGGEMWTRLLDGGGDDGAHGVAVDSGDNVLVAGFTTTGGGTVAVLRKYSATGNLLWSRAASEPATAASAVAVDSADNAVIAGRLNNGADDDAWLAKFDSAGNEQWSDAFDGGGADELNGVAVDVAGNIIAAGSTTESGNINAFIRKWSAAGSELWTVVEDFGGTDVVRGVASDGAGNFIVAGQVDNATADGWIRKYNGDGVEAWTTSFDAGAADSANAIAVGPMGNPVAAGSSNNGSDEDLWVEKYRIEGPAHEDVVQLVTALRDELRALIAAPGTPETAKRALCRALHKLNHALQALVKGGAKRVARKLRQTIHRLDRVSGVATSALQMSAARASLVIFTQLIERIAAVMGESSQTVVTARDRLAVARTEFDSGDWLGAARKAERGVRRAIHHTQLLGNYCGATPPGSDLEHLCQLVDVYADLQALLAANPDRDLERAARYLKRAITDAVKGRATRVLYRIYKAVRKLSRSAVPSDSIQADLATIAQQVCEALLVRAETADLNPAGLAKGRDHLSQGQTFQAAHDWTNATKQFRYAAKDATR